MTKTALETIHEKNKIINNIIDTLRDRNNFLILGHKNPDEDCIASMVSFALIVSKLSKQAHLYFSETVHEHFQYLLNICIHNAIDCNASIGVENTTIDTIVVCDTPKRSMVDTTLPIDMLFDNKGIRKIEIDHHLGADSQYIGDDRYCLVTEANSSSELVGLIAMKFQKRRDLLSKYNIQNLLSRNVILSVLTGIVGDTNMGQYIKSKRQKRYYDIFSNLYNNLLMEKTTQESNLMNKEEVFLEIQRLSAIEEDCFQYIYKKKKFSDSIGYVVLDRNDMDYLRGKFDNDTFVSVSRAIADKLAEESSRMGLVAFDDADNSNLIQFRLRRGQGYKSFDLRRVLDLFSIEDGGGHEGAIGFRITRNRVRGNIDGFVVNMVSGIEKAVGAV